MFTKKTYPTEEIMRTLMVIGGMTEVRGGLDFDVSEGTAFDNWRFQIDGRYGLKDHLELQVGADLQLLGDPQQIDGVAISPRHLLYAGIETGISFETVDFRLLGAIPINDDGASFDIILGFPFRYRFNDKIAIIALDKLLTIHFNGNDPDLTIGVAGAYQIAAKAVALLRVEALFIINEGKYTIPATAALQYSPNNKFDVGFEFTFGDFGPLAEGGEIADVIKSRFFLAYVQARF